MTKNTLTLINRSYIEAVEKSSNIKEIVDNLLDILAKKENIPETDAKQFDAFLKGIHTSKMIRGKTFELTNLVSEITFVIIYIIIWLNSKKALGVDVNLNARRKSLESELSKILDNSYSDENGSIHDRFGLRIILLNSLEETALKDLLFKVSDYIVMILTRINRKIYNEFLSWINKNNKIDSLTKERIKFILNLPFKIYRVKDYVTNPKGNNYQSLHCVLALEMFSEILPGAELELQFRTMDMHRNAVSGSASHDVYEKERRADKNIFTIEDFSKVNIIGFTSYKCLDDDIDGVHFAKIFVNRRISSSLLS